MISIVLICGDRYWINKDVIRRELLPLKEHNPNIIIITGACKGADLLGEEVAKELGFQIKSYPANWNRHGNAAGPIRNQQMIDENKVDLVLAFHSNINNSRGTLNMINKAKAKNIPILLIEK